MKNKINKIKCLSKIIQEETIQKKKNCLQFNKKDKNEKDKA